MLSSTTVEVNGKLLSFLCDVLVCGLKGFSSTNTILLCMFTLVDEIDN